ncbi:MAG: 2Fe-2S iron-sulfur cluster-binding protein [Halapricum sp.]
MDGRHATDDSDEEPAPDSDSSKGLDSAVRRRLLASTASVSALATAGCLGILGDGSETGPRPGEPTPYEETTDDTTPDGTTTPGGAEEFDIEFLNEETTIGIASDETLLEAGEDEGLELPKQCEVGVCGQCTSKVDGDGSELVEHDGNDYLSDEQIEGGFVLTCVGYPRADFSIETDVKDEADSYTPGEETETPPEETTTSDETESYSVEYIEQGGTIDVASDETLLDAGEDEGWELPKQCEVGVCGECTSKVDGDGSELVEHDGNDYLSDEQIQEGYVLTCVGYPRDDFSLTTGTKDEADEI